MARKKTSSSAATPSTRARADRAPTRKAAKGGARNRAATPATPRSGADAVTRPPTGRSRSSSRPAKRRGGGPASFFDRLAECTRHAGAGRYSDGEKVPSGTRASLVAFPGCGVVSVERSEADATLRAGEFMALFAMRLLLGESPDVVAGEVGVPEDDLEYWTERFLAGGLGSLLDEE